MIKLNSKGFGAIEALLIVVIVGVIGGSGYYVYTSQKKTNTALDNAAKSQDEPIKNTKAPTKTAQTADPYEGWKTYGNAKYGISYKYPKIWTTSDDVIADATTQASSATKQEFGTGLKLSTNTKYNDTVTVEVLNESLARATAWYDNYYAQSNLNKVSKTSTSLKGKQSTQYDVTNSGMKSKLYLFSVGDKTYSFGSVNEELNLQAATDYWTTFDKVFDSLEIK